MVVNLREEIRRNKDKKPFHGVARLSKELAEAESVLFDILALLPLQYFHDHGFDDAGTLREELISKRSQLQEEEKKEK